MSSSSVFHSENQFCHLYHPRQEQEQQSSSSCVHLHTGESAIMGIVRAAAVVEYLKVARLPRVANRALCVDCFRFVSLSYRRARNCVATNDEGDSCCAEDSEISDGDCMIYHSVDLGHDLFVRVEEPYELFCMQCGDYSYSKLFDFLIGRARDDAPSETARTNTTIKAIGSVDGAFKSSTRSRKRFSLEEKIVSTMGKSLSTSIK